MRSKLLGIEPESDSMSVREMEDFGGVRKEE